MYLSWITLHEYYEQLLHVLNWRKPSTHHYIVTVESECVNLTNYIISCRYIYTYILYMHIFVIYVIMVRKSKTSSFKLIIFEFFDLFYILYSWYRSCALIPLLQQCRACCKGQVALTSSVSTAISSKLGSMSQRFQLAMNIESTLRSRYNTVHPV